MIHEVPELDINIADIVSQVSSGGMSQTNGLPLILFMNDYSVIKIIFHFKTDYDLALERRNEGPTQWQGINTILVDKAITENVPGETGIVRTRQAGILRNKTKEILEDLKGIEHCPEYIMKYFEFCQNELNSSGAYDEYAIIHMDEYHGFLSSLYKSPAVNGFYNATILGALFEVVFYYFKIKKYLPSFKHNDLHMENIMIDPQEQVDQLKYTKFVTDSGTFYVPYFGYRLRIIDFGLSEIADLGILSVLRNTVSVNKTIEEGLETKLLLRFISLDQESRKLLNGMNDEYIENGLSIESGLFQTFKAKENDPRESLVIRTVSFNDTQN